MPLKTTRRGSNIQTLLPTSEALNACMSIVTTSEAARYFYDELKEKFQEAGMKDESSQVILQEVEKFCQSVDLIRDSGSKVWAGVSPAEGDFISLQQNLAKQRVTTLAAEVKEQPISMDYAVSDEGNFLRGYVIGDKVLDSSSSEDDKIINDIDELYNAWLAENGMLSQGSEIYLADPHGNILKDMQGQKKRAEGRRVRDLMEDPDKGFQQYMSKRGIQVNTTQHSYPKEKVVRNQEVAAEPVEPKVEVQKSANRESVAKPT